MTVLTLNKQLRKCGMNITAEQKQWVEQENWKWSSMAKDYHAKQEPQDKDVTNPTAFSTHLDICVRVLIIAPQHRSGETHPAISGGDPEERQGLDDVKEWPWLGFNEMWRKPQDRVAW